MRQKSDRIVVDTNLWISYLLRGNVGLEALTYTQRTVILVSQEIISEIIDVSERPKIKRFVERTDLDKLISVLSDRAELITIRTNVSICRDLKDNFLLALARDGNATHLLTGDKDLLVLEKFEGTLIMKITDYLSENPHGL